MENPSSVAPLRILYTFPPADIDQYTRSTPRVFGIPSCFFQQGFVPLMFCVAKTLPTKNDHLNGRQVLASLSHDTLFWVNVRQMSVYSTAVIYTRSVVRPVSSRQETMLSNQAGSHRAHTGVLLCSVVLYLVSKIAEFLDATPTTSDCAGAPNIPKNYRQALTETLEVTFPRALTMGSLR